MSVGLDELPDGQAICGFLWGDGDVFAHLLRRLAASKSIRRFGFLLRPFNSVELMWSRQYVQDIFTIGPIAIKY
jgi:hypothetical protein